MWARRTVGALAAVLVLACATSAAASSIVYVCGRKLSFVKANRLYLAQGDATHARQVKDAPLAALTWMRPDGRQVAYIRSVNTIISPGFTYPYYSPPIYGFVPYLFLGDAAGDKTQTLARDTTSAGWLRDEVVLPYPAPGDGPR